MRLIAWIIRLLFRLVLLPFKLLLATLGITFKTGYKVGTAPVKVGWRATRAAGVSGVVCFFLGLLIGLFFAPGPGRELRAKLQAMLGGGGGVSDDELAEKVTFELGHAPRTWHLPQPEVAVVGNRVTLRGAVPHDEAREELVRVASAVGGVDGVDDLLVIETVEVIDGAETAEASAE